MPKEINIKKTYSYLSFVFIIILVSLVNEFPNNYVFLGGDVAQFFKLNSLLSDYYPYLFAEGAYNPTYTHWTYYYLFNLLANLLNLDIASSYSILYYFIFLFISFNAFFISTFNVEMIVGKKIDLNIKLLFSFVYSFNIYTFYVFYYTWGFSPYLLIYTVLPILITSSYIFFTSNKKSISFEHLFILTIAYHILGISFGNFSMLVSYSIVIFSLVLYLALKNKVNNPIQKSFIFGIHFILVLGYYFVPQVPEMFAIKESIREGGQVFNYFDWLIGQREKLSNVFLIRNYSDHFPFLITSIFYFAVPVILFIMRKRNDILTVFLIAILVVLIFFLTKGNGYLNNYLTDLIFNNIIMLSVRSYDKFLLFIPFTLITLALVLIVQLKERRVFLLSIFILPTMLVFGMFLSSSIQKEYSAGLEEGSNYKDSDTSYLINIPESYYEVIEYINQDLSEFKVAMFPYAVINSLGWMNIPKLKYVGGDIFSQLLNNDMLLLNSYHNYTTLNFGKYWNEESTYNSEWMMYYLGNIGVKYIIYNKNFPKQFIGKTLDKMGYLESVGLIDNILENQDIILYKIGQDYVNNLFYIPNKVNHYTSGLNVQPLFDKFSKDSIYLKENLTFESNSNYIIKEQVEINPTKYKVKVKCSEVLDKNFIFIFNHKYTDSFKVFLKNTNDGEYYSVPSAHYKVNDYSNLWSVDVEYLKKNISDNYFELEIIYYPQMIRDMFLYISLIISIIFSLMYFYLQYYKMHAKK